MVRGLDMSRPVSLSRRRWPYGGRVQVAARTEIGHVRSRNEDALLVAGEERVLAVCDGLGGHPCGDIASATAVESLRQSAAKAAVSADDLVAALRAAHEAVLEAAGGEPGRADRDGDDGRGRHGRGRLRAGRARRRQPRLPARRRRPDPAGDPGPRDGWLHHPGPRPRPRRGARPGRARDARGVPAAALQRRPVQHGRRARHRLAARRGRRAAGLRRAGRGRARRTAASTTSRSSSRSSSHPAPTTAARGWPRSRRARTRGRPACWSER